MPIKNRQLIANGENGDCLRACVTSVMGTLNTLDDPNPHKGNWLSVWRKWLADFGIEVQYTKSCWIDGYWIASVPSKNYKGKTHAIVMKGTKVWHDPSTKKRYRTNRDMLGSGLVGCGYIFIVSDFFKLTKALRT